jgi:hypothetical protein
MPIINPAAQQMYAAAAAHGITPRTVATWSSLVPRTPRVMVPIQLDALVVRQGGGTWADCRMSDPPPGVTSTNRRALLPPPFTDKTTTRNPGVYLHWALPDALTRGVVSGNDATFPAIPDRWLVLRFYPSGSITDRREVEGWVLRSGDFPTDGSLPQPIPLDQWVETGPNATSIDSLTATGRGDAAWAAYYDNVENRLGFYDSLSDIKQGPLAYLVCGWYSNPDRDPLGAAQIKSLSDFYAQMAEFQWKLDDNELEQSQAKSWGFVSAATQLGLATREATAVGQFQNFTAASPGPAGARVGAALNASQWIPSPGAQAGWQPAALDPSGHPQGGEYVTNGSWWPEQIILHGSAVAIPWPGAGWDGMPQGILSGDFGGPPAASSVNVIVGTTPTDALASVVAKVRQNPDEARLLEAFMLGSLSDFDQADGPSRTDSLLQANAFFSRDGGQTTEQIWIPATPPMNPASPASPPAPKDSGIFTPSATQAMTALKTHKTVEAKASFAESATLSSAASDVGQLFTVGATPSRFSQVYETSNLHSILQLINQGFTPPPQTPGHYETVQRAQPRYFQPSDPVIMVQGAARSFRHGKDGRYNSDGTLSCMLTGFAQTELACNAINGMPIRPSVRGEDLLTRGVENGSVPPECDELLHATVLQDPGASVVAAQQSIWMMSGVRQVVTAAGAPPAVDPAALQALANNYAVEQTAWWSTRDPRVDHGPLLAYSGAHGTLPSPIAVTMPTQPWAPIHLDWEVQYVPSKGGIADWTLDENDFIPDLTKLPSTDDIAQGVTLKGRAHLTAGVADTVAAAVRTSLAQAALSAGSGSINPGKREAFYSQYAQQMMVHFATLTEKLTVKQSNPVTSGGAANGGVSTIDRSGLEDIASALENMDVLCGALDAFHQRLRGGIEGDGTSVPAQGQPTPSPFFPIRAGFLSVVRLRLVDTFGQILDLAGSDAQTNVNPQLVTSSIPMELDAAPQLQLLPPRFTSPSRLWLRFADPSGAVDDKGLTVQADVTISPVCGYLVPNHLDGDLEFFDDTGQNLGDVRPDPVAGIVWEDAPGVPSTVGQTPERAIPNQFLAGIAKGLLDWGTADASLNGAREDALSSILRIIDSTLWSVDPFGHTGDEHLSLLIGHPVAVLRASVRLEVEEPITLDVVNQIALPLRLGALKHWQDGLFGYFINDDYRTFYCSDAAVAGFAREFGPNQGFLQQINLVDNYYQQFTDDLGADVTAGDPNATPPAQGRAPVTHPYVNGSGVMTIQPNQEIKLTLLMEPHALIHGTAGLLPRKDIGLRRGWIANALAKISPTFRFGPVLVDPKTIRMPIPTEAFGAWSWDHRTSITAWAEDKVVNATDGAILPVDPVTASEGWLRLSPTPPPAPGTTGQPGQG